ncbi:NUDIX hydrolase [Staphylococcus ratti]|uniref:NUDIX domain-containing protein n=1 Tax=Staphylococcus ratti TaxID=2892440 RepID=A0ABY3PDK2_9STAP|nr:NUDIX domain-containing protein [Staphylococcus ratti]UEX90405.1 NUDIX domain-containing protein [Staphylococcus ratti]
MTIRCVCLVERKGSALRLVQVRHREKMYFPGGKIDVGETLEAALIREVKEELQLDLTEDDIEFIGSVVGPAYPQPDETTELNGFRAKREIDWTQVAIDSEITNIDWVDIDDQQRIAPAVLKWIDKYEK